MTRILPCVEHDSHRQALDHFYVVASGVFGGKKAEAIAARARQIPYITLIAAADGVYVDGDFLAGTHACQLSLLEIRGDPYLVRLGHEHQGLSRFDSRAKLDAALADDPVGWRVDF